MPVGGLRAVSSIHKLRGNTHQTPLKNSEIRDLNPDISGLNAPILWWGRYLCPGLPALGVLSLTKKVDIHGASLTEMIWFDNVENLGMRNSSGCNWKISLCRSSISFARMHSRSSQQFSLPSWIFPTHPGSKGNVEASCCCSTLRGWNLRNLSSHIFRTGFRRMWSSYFQMVPYIANATINISTHWKKDQHGLVSWQHFSTISLKSFNHLPVSFWVNEFTKLINL